MRLMWFLLILMLHRVSNFSSSISSSYSSMSFNIFYLFLGPENIKNKQITNISTSSAPVIIKNECRKNSSDTSILETASLMKKSVFLSPTFIPTIGNVIPGQVEISSKNDTEDPIAVTDLVGAQNSVYIPVDSFESTKIYPEAHETRKAFHKVDQVTSSCDRTVNGVFTSTSKNGQDFPSMSLDGNEIQVEDVSDSNKNLTKQENSVSYILYDSHSFKTAKMLESSLKPMDSSCMSDENINAVKPKQKSSSKINIITQETIPLPKLQLKSLQNSHINTLTPVPVNTIINNKIKNKSSSSEASGSSEQIPMGTLNNAELKEVNCEVNINESNLKPKDNINAALRDISSQELEKTCSRNSDIASNITDLRKMLENEKNTKHICHLSLQDNSITIGEKTVNNAVSSNKEGVVGQLNEHQENFEDTLSVIPVNGFNKHDIDADSVDENKCVKSTHVYYNGQKDENTEPEVSYVYNRHFTKNEHDSKDDNAEKSNTIEKFNIVDKFNIAENSSNPNFNLQSDSKQVTDCKMRTDEQTNNIISLKNLKEKPLCTDELANILNVSKELSSSNSDIKVDKVKEIAAYLKKFSHIYTDKKKIKKDLKNDRNLKEKINSNTNMIKSKLSIQGVEKPGGIRENIGNINECKVLKTYTRMNHINKSKPFANILHKSEACDTVDESINYEINSVNVSTTLCKMQEFCICYDFGRLDYYDYDRVYEHIHFLQNNTANCDLNVIFSIYSDEAIVNNNEIGLLDQEQKTEENLETHVCWNVFQNDLSENVDISDPEHIQHEYSIDGLNLNFTDTETCLGETPSESELNNVTQENSTVSEIHQGHMIVNNNQNTDIVLKTIDHDMVGTAGSKNFDSIEKWQTIEKSLNTDKDIDNATSTKVTAVETAYSENIDLGSTDPNLPVSIIVSMSYFSVDLKVINYI